MSEGNKTEVTDAFRPILLESLELESVPDFGLYTLTQGQDHPVLYRGPDLPFGLHEKERLLENNVKTIYITSSDRPKYSAYLERILKNTLQDPRADIKKKSAVVYDSARFLTEEVLMNPRSGENVRKSKEMVEQTVTFLLNDTHAFHSLLSVASFDYYTHTHSVNVCVFCVALAQRIQGYTEEQLRVLGAGSLLHDVGKVVIDKRIILKRGPLTKLEWEQIRQHPDYGIRILTPLNELAPEALKIVLCHHEKWNGSGYPYHLVDGDIHPYARMAAICDVFDALTTRRCYRGAIESFSALRLMEEEMSDCFDKELFREFILLMGKTQTK